MYNIDIIRKLFKHSYPFLLLDKIISVDYGKSSVALKNLTINEPFFQGHFSEYPLFPGVLMIETMAQTCGCIFVDPQKKPEDYSDNVPVLTGANNVKFKKQARPGDQLIVKAELKQNKSFFYVFDCKLFIKDHENTETLASSAEIRLAIRNFGDLME